MWIRYHILQTPASTSSNITLTINEDTAYKLKSSDFNFSDLDTWKTLSKVKITTLETKGALQHYSTIKKAWLDVALNAEISSSDINAGYLKFTPVANANGVNYTTFKYQVSDGTVPK